MSSSHSELDWLILKIGYLIMKCVLVSRIMNLMPWKTYQTLPQHYKGLQKLWVSHLRKTKKRIKKLCKNSSKSGKGKTKIVANVETSSRFAPLAHACTDNDPKSHRTKSAKPKCHTRVKRTRKTKSQRNVNDNKKPKTGENYRCIYGEGLGKACNRQNPGYLRMLLPMPWRQSWGHPEAPEWYGFKRWWC